MVFLYPRFEVHPKLFGQRPHLFDVGRGDGIGSFVVRYVAFFSKVVELLNASRICALCLIAAGRKRGCRDLQRCVVGNIEAPIVVKARSLRRSQITIGNGQQFCDLVSVRLVHLGPSELLPIFQAHPRPQSGRVYVL